MLKIECVSGRRQEADVCASKGLLKCSANKSKWTKTSQGQR